MPRFAASVLIDSVLAVRQALSAPICEKPTAVFPFSPPCFPPSQDAARPTQAASTAPSSPFAHLPALRFMSGSFLGLIGAARRGGRATTL